MAFGVITTELQQKRTDTMTPMQRFQASQMDKRAAFEGAEMEAAAAVAFRDQVKQALGMPDAPDEEVLAALEKLAAGATDAIAARNVAARELGAKTTHRPAPVRMTPQERAIALGCTKREAEMLAQQGIDPAAYIAKKREIQARSNGGRR